MDAFVAFVAEQDRRAELTAHEGPYHARATRAETDDGGHEGADADFAVASTGDFDY